RRRARRRAAAMGAAAAAWVAWAAWAATRTSSPRFSAPKSDPLSRLTGEGQGEGSGISRAPFFYEQPSGATTPVTIIRSLLPAPPSAPGKVSVTSRLKDGVGVGRAVTVPVPAFALTAPVAGAGRQSGKGAS